MAKPAYTIKQLEPDGYDTRLIERHMGEGKISSKEHAARLGRLVDDGDNAEEFEVTLGEDPTAVDK